MESIKIQLGELKGYKLLDCGEKQKLEEVGGIRIVRSEPRAWWKKSLPENEWGKAQAAFESENQKSWKFAQDLALNEAVVNIGIEGIKAKVRFGGRSKHIGIFPEQAGQWRWIRDRIMNHKSGIMGEKKEERKLNILNLFGYTGIASLVAVASDAAVKVTHVDASAQSINWAKVNQRISGLENAPIRWVVDDVLKFIKREIKRGERYNAIILDPPSYGRGPKGEVWKAEEKLGELLESCGMLLTDRPLFVLFNMYSTELSSLSLRNMLVDMVPQSIAKEGHFECGEHAIRQANSSRLLPMSIFALWTE
jgi:23S rRNA (cytosine1962-C5)-methyltransferase